MHVPNLYKNQNLAEVKSFLTQNSFAILINQSDGKLTGSHIPLELETDKDGKEVLVGHLGKANPQARAIADNQKVLVIFNGPHSYISSSWYTKEEVPTWNYVAVHVYGVIKLQNEGELLDSLTKLVDKYEKHSKNPVSVAGLSKKTMRQVNGIVGFKIIIGEIQAAYKLSQNRNDNDHQNIIRELEETGDFNAKGVAEEMRKNRDSKS